MLVKAAVGLLAAAGATTAVVVAVAPESQAAEQAVVTHLVDGDTLDVRIEGRTERIRLLNVDAPEVTGPDAAEQCLGQEASAHLAALVPVGTPVRLEYDEERTDRYDRTLAGVFTADGGLVNAEMARAGLAVPVVVGENDRFHPPVVAARDEAAQQQRGLFSPEVACTLPGQVAAVSAIVAAAPDVAAQPADASSGTLDSSAALAAAAVAAVRGLEDAFAVADPAGIVWRALTQDERAGLAEQVRGLREGAQHGADALRDAAAGARAQEEEAARVAAEQERARLEEEQRQARLAEEQRQARLAEEQRQAHLAEERRQARLAEEQRQARLAEERRAAAEQERRERAEAEAEARRRADAEPEASGGGDPYPGYTGPRCYAPGGKTWRPC